MYSYSSVKIVPIGTQKNPFGNSIPKGFEKKIRWGILKLPV